MSKFVVAFLILLRTIDGARSRHLLQVDHGEALKTLPCALTRCHPNALANLFLVSHRASCVLTANNHAYSESYPRISSKSCRIVQSPIMQDATDQTLLLARLRVEVARATLEKEDTREARAELKAAEADLLALQLDDVAAAVKEVADSKALKAQTLSEKKEAWELQKVIQGRHVIDMAEATLKDIASSDWRKIMRCLSDLESWTRRGSTRAESLLLDQLTKHSGMGVAKEADEYIRRAWRTNDNLNVLLHLDRGMSALRAGNATRALSFYDRLCEELAPEWAESWHQRGKCLYYGLQQYEESERCFEKALSLNPSRYPTMLELASLLMAERGGIATEEVWAARQARAQELLDEAVRICPQVQLQVQAMKKHGLRSKPSPLDLPDKAVVAIAGGATPLGQLIVRALAKKDLTVQELSLTAPAENIQGVDAVIIITETAGGNGGIDSSEVPKLLPKLHGARRFVMASVRGVDDTSIFTLANVFGQLDKQRFAEEDLILYCRAQQTRNKITLQEKFGNASKNVPPFPDYTIIRFGKLIDDSDRSVLSDVAGPPKSRGQLVLGDETKGDTLLSAAAAVLIEALKQPTGATLSLGEPDPKAAAIANLIELLKQPIGAKLSPGEPLAKALSVNDDQVYWDDQFLKCVGPEILRKPFTGPTTEMVAKLRRWALKFQGGKGLTSPAFVSEVDNGAFLQFQTRGAKENDGALLFIAEEDPYPRVRVVRQRMDEREDIVSKPMSEDTLLGDLEKLLRGG